MSSVPTVSQTNAQAGGDVVAGNKSVVTNHYTAGGPAVIDQLLAKLQVEIDGEAQTRTMIESLARFQVRRSQDGVIGLEDKLKKANREHEIFDALEKKELFAKLLDTWSLYASAQEIFARLLAKAEYEFNFFIQPVIGDLDEVQLNQLINDKVVEPTTNICGGATFSIDHAQAMGMIYWLAEQCFVRWHK